jgi:hypothetical protein
MSGYLLTGFAGLVLATIARGLVRPERFYEYPYFMAAVFGVFILPQAISLVQYPGEASPDGVSALLAMTIFCLTACIAGYQVRANRWIIERAVIAVDRNRLFAGAVLYIIIAYFFTYQISEMTFEERGGSTWSGKVTIYQFFVGLIYPGLAICLSRALRTQSQASWLMTCIATFLPLVSIVFFGRREEAALLAMTIGLTLYFQRRRAFPRMAIVAALAVATLLIPGTSQYRAAMKTGGYAQLRQVDFINNFWQFLNKAQILELRNAAIIVEATQASGDFGYGRAYWDQVVFRFVPAQIVGKDVKDGLMFNPPKRGIDVGMLKTRYKQPNGTTVTGMGDSFHEFWYFGALFFAILAVVFKSLWHASLHRDAIFAQLLYIQTSTAAMRAITHQTVDYLPGLVYNLIFIGALVYFARSHGHEASRVRRTTEASPA